MSKPPTASTGKLVLVTLPELAKITGLSHDTIKRRRYDGTLTVLRARNGRALRCNLAQALAELFEPEDNAA
jgi:hypothetical protein